MGVIFRHFWCQLGVSSFGERDSSFLAWFFCGKASQEGLDGSPPLHFFDNLAGETDWFLRM